MASHPPAGVAPPRSRPAARRVVVPTLTSLPEPAAWAPPRGGAAPTEVPERARRAAHGVARALAEVVQGRRAPAQLEGILAPAAVALCEEVAGSCATVRLRSVRVQMPTRDAVEASVHLADGVHSHAAALRLEAGTAGWRCVVLQFAGAPPGVSRAGASCASGGWPAGGPSPATAARGVGATRAGQARPRPTAPDGRAPRPS